MSPIEPKTPESLPLNLAAVRDRLASMPGQPVWRSLEEVSSDAFQEFLQREFPRQASAWNPALDRRGFLTLLGASLALAGLSGCAAKQPTEKIVPYVNPSEEIVPGKPLVFATALTLGGFATGVLVTSREGRPIKIEGNPDHPASLGATDAILQAMLLDLYDPERSQAIIHSGRPDTWDAFLGAVEAGRRQWQADGGAGLRILTETVTSPTLAAQIGALRTRYPQMQWHQYEPVHRDNVRAGAMRAFGRDVHTVYDFRKAEVILALDGDFLLTMPGHLRYARDFSDQRRVLTGSESLPARSDTMNRLYAAESSPTLTGAIADHRIALRPGEIERVAQAVAHRLGIGTGEAPTLAPELQQWIDVVAADLQAHPGASLIVPGAWQSPSVHALCHAMNGKLGNAGQTLRYTDPIEAEPTDQTASLKALVQAMQTGQVQTLLILGGNPVYTTPADLDFAAALKQVPLSIHLSAYEDETSALCRWHIPEQHPLEAWSDTRAYDGTITIQQPLIAPLYDSSRSAHEVLDALASPTGRTGHDIVKAFWQEHHLGRDFEAFWRKTLQDGLISGSAAPAITPTLLSGLSESSGPLSPSPTTGNAQEPASGVSGTPSAGNSDSSAGAWEILFRPDPTIWDGRFANNGWLQELPKPLSKLTWDNAALISPRTAETQGLANEEVVELRYQGRAVRAPIWILPGHPDGCVTVTLGYGRTCAGSIGTGPGVNAYALRASDTPWHGTGLEIHKTGEQHRIACTHTHHTMEGRDLIRIGSIETFRQDRNFVHAKPHKPDRPPMLLPESPRNGYAWGMAIDNNVCIGCNACVAACQAENNIPVVGKEEVLRGREMHWIRIDRYYTGKNLNRPDGTYFMPVPCMHCEKAPCELVCPVGATVHDADGLNEMVYNRCVGTRYCSNNCPYKVRRFNFLQYSSYNPTLQLMRNPEVTTRSRGVMEKCTYCIQRIQNAKIEAEKQDRTVRDGEIQTACQQSCPTRAITFGDLNDPISQVAKLQAEPHNYSLLSELNTRPRTTYLATLRNPNSDLEAK